MVNYTNRVMTAIESAMGHEIAWPDRQERAVNFAHFAGLGFPGYLRPNKHIIYFFAGMPGSCHDLTCLRRSSLWGRLGFAQLFDNGQYLLSDSGYIPLDRLVCSYKRTGGDMDKVDFNTCIAHARVGNEHCIGILKARWHSLKEINTQLRNPVENAYVIRWIRCCIILHNFIIWRRDEWSEDDHPIELETEDDMGPPPQGARECNRCGLERRQATTSVREFILNWDDRVQSSTVGGREVPLTIDTVREYFLLPEGSLVPRTTRHYDDLSNWVPERSRTAKTWYANDVFLPLWRPIIQLVNVVLLGKQKPLEVTGAFLYILKNKVGHADEEEDLDWPAYFKEKLRDEIRACKKQMQASGKRKVRPTCIGIVVLHILQDMWYRLESSSTPERVQDLTSNSPEGRQVSPDPRDILSSSSTGRHKDRPDPTDIPSSSSPGRRKQASPTRAVRQHSLESSPGAPSTLSDHTTSSGSPSSPDREDTGPSDNEPLVGFGSPMVPYPPDDDEAEEAIAVLTSLAASDPSPASKGKRPVDHRSSS
ncbi:hypothetical protein R1sor_019048 [Riccia sorocarpa]|uniref:DDE Tnp4 domain-containing protein n=1 Tax=Riccia sorocarpa TaxID=122646 RepID=A0ABD3ICJ9_9MARC